MGKPIRRVAYLSSVTLLLAALLLGCAGVFENYGHFRPSEEVSDAFQSFRVMDQYNYFFIGPDSNPDAIIGLLKDYTLDSNLWKPVDLTPAILERWVRLMNWSSYPMMLYGNYITDQANNTIGVWYSLWDTTSVKVGQDKHVTVFVPQGGPMNQGLKPFQLGEY